jgi:hypothetical protein
VGLACHFDQIELLVPWKEVRERREGGVHLTVIIIPARRKGMYSEEGMRDVTG